MKKYLLFIFLFFLALCINLFSQDNIIAKFKGGIVTSEDINILFEDVPAPFRKLIKNKTDFKKKAILLKLIGLEYQNKKLDKLTLKKIEFCKNKILLKKYFEDKLKNITVDEKEIKNYYEDHKQEYSEQISYKFKLISFNSLEEANKILEKIKKGKKFENFSPNSSSNKYIPEKFLPQQFIKIFKNLKKGEISTPIKYNNKYFLVKLDDRKIIPEKTFEQVKESIKRKLLLNKKNKLKRELEEKLFKKYQVKIIK